MSVDDLQFEAPIEIPIGELDKRFAGFYTVDPLGARGIGSPPLLAANLKLTGDIIDRIRQNADRLGEDDEPLETIRLKRAEATHVPRKTHVLPAAKRKVAFRAISTSFHSITDQFKRAIPDSETLLEQAGEETLEKVRAIKIDIPTDFRDTLGGMLESILQGEGQATLFACLDTYDDGCGDHSLRVFLMGTKLLANLFHITPEKLQQNKRLFNYAYGLLYHDCGMMLIPDSIMKKTLRIPETQLTEIRARMQRCGVDMHHFTTIMAVNDPRYVYRPNIEKRLTGEVQKLRPLVEQGILSERQLTSLLQFPQQSCLSKAERALLEKHPVFGWEILKSSGFSSPQALDIVRHHHQRTDMSGYPDRQTSMSMEAQVAAAVDIFDALVSDRPYRDAKPYDVAFGILDAMTLGGTGHVPQLDRRIYELFCANVQKYPDGSFVRMHGGTYDGCVAQVIEYSVYNPDRPSVVVFQDRSGSRLAQAVRLTLKDYDGSFQVRGLPFTKAMTQSLLRPAVNENGT